MKSEDEKLYDKSLKLFLSNSNIISYFKLFRLYMNLRKNISLEKVKVFVNGLYWIEDEYPDDFYEMIFNAMNSSNYMSLFKAISKMNIYDLITYLKSDDGIIDDICDVVSPLQYFCIPKRYINRIVDKLKSIPLFKKSILDDSIKEELAWKLKKSSNNDESSYISIAYKMYLSIGLDNSIDLLNGKYGDVDYDKIYYLFSKFNVKDSIKEINSIIRDFLFANKKDSNNVVRQMLNGEFNELFLNFDYFYNNIFHFINKLGTKFNSSKVKLLLEERYISKNIEHPQISGDVVEDMLSSYYCRYDVLDTSEQEILEKNFDIYNEFLSSKIESSIPEIDAIIDGDYYCEVLKLNDPKNLVLGYRSGNCFRINGEAAILFKQFLKSDHMRLVSISTSEHRDFAMMLVMRNGNVLIGQGIEVSKWAPESIKGEKLYNACRKVLKEMMNYMNNNGDHIVATIIGSSNENVSKYNQQIVPFIVNPILDNGGNYYNGVANYQCLLDLNEGDSLSDIKLFVPVQRYLDKRRKFFTRYKGIDVGNFFEIEKRLIALRNSRTKREGYEFYHNINGKKEHSVFCNTDWYIMIFEDGSVDSYICSEDERAFEEYNMILSSYKKYMKEVSRLVKNK